MGEIQFNEAAFDSRISEIQSKTQSLSATKIEKIVLSTTNLTRMKQYCETSADLIEQLNQYEALLKKDLRKLKKVGEAIVEKDRELSQSMGGNSSSKQSIR